MFLLARFMLRYLLQMQENNDNNVLQGGSKQVRFQPQYGQLLATAIGNSITIIDVETDSHLHDLKVPSVCIIC